MAKPDLGVRHRPPCRPTADQSRVNGAEDVNLNPSDPFSVHEGFFQKQELFQAAIVLGQQGYVLPNFTDNNDMKRP